MLGDFMAQLSTSQDSALASIDARVLAIFERYSQQKKTTLWVFKWMGWLILTGIGALVVLPTGFVLYLGALFIFIDHVLLLATYRKLLQTENLQGTEMYYRAVSARNKAIGHLVLWAVAMSLPVLFVAALVASHH